ncbi:MAG: leucine-rich repeat domain-containing protein [Eubacteriales bacterium]|nr:leucine-rich repeat domain-containing protein [Eubacteriales bacterium]
MKYLKKGVFLAALVLMMNLVLSVSAATQTDGLWEYTVSSGEATITGYNGSAVNISIPTTLGGYPVTKLGSYVFRDSNIQTVSIPERIEDIGNGAFENCKYLTNVSFNAKNCGSCSSVGPVFENAGKFSSSLTVTFGSAVQKIPACLFYSSEGNYAHVTSVVIPNGVQKIGNCAFENCLDLKEVTWGTGLIEIDSYAFKNCIALESVTIPECTESIGFGAFENCKYLQRINYNAVNCSISTAYGGKVFYNCGKFSSSLKIVFGNTVETIPAKLCYGANITSVLIPKNVKEIGIRAFESNENLKEVTVYARTVKYTDYDDKAYSPFKGCPSTAVFKGYRNSTTAAYAQENGFSFSPLDPAVYLSACKVKLSSTNVAYNGKARKPSVTVSYDGQTLKEGSDYTVSYRNNVSVGTAEVILVGMDDYQGTVTKKFTISLKNGSSFQAGSYTYKITSASAKTVQLTKGKTSLSSIAVPSTVSYGGTKFKVTSIGAKAFYKCKATKATIGKNVISIGSNAFAGCTALKSVSIGQNVETIGTKAFYGDKKLKTITIKTTKLTAKTVGSSAFKNIYAKAKITVPASKRKAYKTLLRQKGLSKSAVIC